MEFLLPESIRDSRTVASEQYEYLISQTVAPAANKLESAVYLNYLLPEACHFLQQAFGDKADLRKQSSRDKPTYQCLMCPRKPMRDSGTLKHM